MFYQIYLLPQVKRLAITYKHDTYELPDKLRLIVGALRVSNLETVTAGPTPQRPVPRHPGRKLSQGPKSIPTGSGAKPLIIHEV